MIIDRFDEKYICQTKQNFSAQVEIPGSKSISNRALILAALEEKKVILKNFLISDDTIYMIEALKKIGYSIIFSDDMRTLTIEPSRDISFENVEIYTGNAGTVMRFIASFFLTKKSKVTLIGNPRMNERPIKDLADSLTELGAHIRYLEKSGYPPIEITSQNRLSERITIDCDRSSQYLSSLLLSAPYFEKGLTVEIKNRIVSRPYVDMSIKMIEDFGGKVVEEKRDKSFHIPHGTYNLNSYLVEGDMSSASYFLALALITDSTVRIDNFFRDSIQGDRRFLEIFLQMGGAILEEGETYIVVKGCCSYQGIDIDLNTAPDIAQTLAVTALFADSPTTVTNVANMRIKETDRISALKTEIERVGGGFIEHEDSFTVVPAKNYKAAEIETYDDHRMAMSFTLAGFRISGLIIKDPKCVTKTFPGFFNIIDKI